MKTEAQIIEGIETGEAYMQEDAQTLLKQISRKDWPAVIKNLNQMSVTAAALLAAKEILN
jgi:uncharacterized membrane-anchored protein